MKDIPWYYSGTAFYRGQDGYVMGSIPIWENFFFLGSGKTISRVDLRNLTSIVLEIRQKVGIVS